MRTVEENRFLRRLRTALGHAPDVSRDAKHLFAQGPSAEDLQMLDRIDRRSTADRQTLLQGLMEAGKPINLKVVPVADLTAACSAVVAVVAERTPEWGESKGVAAWRHPLIDRLGLAEALAAQQVPLRVTDPIDPHSDGESERRERERQRADIIASFIGVTGADFCLADTATLVLRNRPGQPRSAALVPSIHVAVITLDQILFDMKELFALLRWDEQYRHEGISNYMSFISGPSKTADIEATMVQGAHGPREVHLFVISG
ncbi:MAG: LUD domain-containing protein [Desulfobacterales bacterium]